jgi:Fe-S-cluster containining protein
MKLKLNSLDIKLLCDKLKISTKQFHSKYTTIIVGKNDLPEYLLKTKPQCVFYNEGCTVHESRPISCRLYPFGSYNVFDKIYYFKVNHCQGFEKKKKITINRFIKENKLDNYLSFVNRWELVNNIKLSDINDQSKLIESYKQLLYFFDSNFTKRFIKEHKIQNYPFEDKILYFINYLLELN